MAGLCLLQLVVGVSALAGLHRLAVWAALLCPLGILMICVARMGPNAQWASLRIAEWAFLAGNLASTAAAIALIRSRARPAWATGGLWLVNSSFCGFMVYLAFFFRLF